MKFAPWGHVAEWLRNGLQNRVHQFNSGRGLHHTINGLHLIVGEAAAGFRAAFSRRRTSLREMV
jgi:hypothetical protein